MPHRVPYLTGDLELVKSRLQGILTCDEPTAAKLAKSDFPTEVLAVAKIFNEATESLHHKWGPAILGSVPPEAWVLGSHGEEEVRPTKDASLRLWSLEGSEQSKENFRIGQIRQQVFTELQVAMPASLQKHYRSMLSWVRDQSEAPLKLASGPLGSDTVFGHLIACLEKWMDMRLQETEKFWLQQHDWPISTSVPPKVIQELSREARDYLKGVLTRWFDKDSSAAKPIQNSLLALVSVNLSANRVLLEYAAKEARGLEAADLAIGILEKLNKRGITEVPVVMDNLSPDGARQMLKDVLTSWFGPGGSLIGLDSDFKRPMNHTDIDLAVRWSTELQEQYIVSRGQRGGLHEARENHGKSPHTFMFAMTLVGAFYNSAKTDNEFKGRSNSSYAVFPGRKLISKGATRTPPSHAAELLMQAYGQIFFGNSGWDIVADGVTAYAKTTSIKRAHIQQLIRFAIKDRTSSSVLKLSKHLDEMKDRPLSGIED